MKKLATALAALATLALAAPVFACPHEDAKKAEKTAQKKKDDQTTESTETAKADKVKTETAPKTADTTKVNTTK